MIRNINGKDYTFKITRKGLRQAERAGFNVSEIGEKPVLGLSYLWYAALYAAQPMKFDAAEVLLDEWLDKGEESFSEVMSELSSEYAEVFGVAAE